MGFSFTPEFLKKNLVTEVDVCVLSSLCSTVALSIGYRFQSNSGKTGLELLKKYTETIKMASACEGCVRSQAPYLNTVKPDILDKCSSFCQDCWENKNICESCLGKGRTSIYPQLEPCDRCLDNNIKCRKNVVLVVALDCFTGNRFLIEKFQDQRKRGTRDPEVYLTEPLGEVVHVLKTIKSSSSNWYLLTPCGTLHNLSLLRTLRDENGNKIVTEMLRKVIQRSSVVNRDRQDTDCLIEFAQLGQVLERICQVDPIVLHQIVPEKYKLEPTNKPEDLGEIKCIGAININHLAVLCKNQDNSCSVSVLELHSPVRISNLMKPIQAVSSMTTSEGMLIISTTDGLKYVEIVKGTVVPKLPAKKDDLKHLCSEMDLDTAGKVVDLRARLKKYLSPRMDTEGGNFINNTECLKSSVICKFKVENGRIKSLVAAIDADKLLVKVELIYAKGEVSVHIVNNIDYSESKVISIEVEVDRVYVLNESKLQIFNENMIINSEVDLSLATKDICIAGNELFFLHEETVSVDTLSNLEDGKHEPVTMIGALKSNKSDGSGNTSLVRKASCLASYQHSILIGTTDGKVKLASMLEPIAQFYKSTFKPAVEGFGLHKKNCEGSKANLETSREAFIEISDYISRSEENIRISFDLQLPVKLNGQQHMISAVTKGTVAMAADSLSVIQENINLVESLKTEEEVDVEKELTGAEEEQSKESSRINSDNTGTEVPVEDGDVTVSVDADGDIVERLASLAVVDVIDMFEDIPDHLKHLTLIDLCK